jgi:AAA+ superfamily predicted ATPase
VSGPLDSPDTVAVADFFSRVGSRAVGGNSHAQPSPGGYPLSVHPSAVSGIERASCWAQADNGYYGIAKAHPLIPPGMYRCGIDDRYGPILLRQQIDLDGIVPLPDSASAEVIREIREFRQMKERFTAHGFLHKRGILLWGPAGSGKTVTVHQIARLIVGDECGIATLVDAPHITAACLQLLRRIEPDRPVVAIFEDLDALIARFGENEYLALLDGEAQVDNIVFIATTNYPEDLDARFVDRPSRFDTVRYIGMPNDEARSTYLQAKAPALINGRLEEYVTASAGFSIAHLKELVVLTQCFGYPLQDAAARISKMKVKPNAQRSPDRSSAGL